MSKAILIVSLYVITAYLGLLLAVPAGYATAIWAPAGIALGSVLVWGLRSLPSVFLGSFIINFYISCSNLDCPLTMTIACLIAFGAVLQAFWGWWLIKRYLGLDNPLIYPKDIILFAILAGPLSCLVNASWSIIALHLLQVLTVPNIMLTWMTWWVGDSIGALLVTPIFLICFRPNKKRWQKRLIQQVLPLCISFVAYICIYIVVVKIEINRVSIQFNAKSQNIVDDLQDQLIIAMNSASALAAHLSIMPDITNTTFSEYAQAVTDGHSYLQALEWAPEIHDIVKFENTYHIPIVTISINNNTAQANHSSYYPILYAAPLAENKDMIGFDFLSRSFPLAHIEDSIKTHKTLILAPIHLSQDKKSDLGSLLVSPVYNKQKFTGFSLILINMTKLAKEAMIKTQDFSEFTVMDSFTSKKVVDFLNSAERPQDPKYLFTYRTTIAIGSDSWVVKTTSSTNYINHAFSWQAWFLLPAGLLFCVLINSILLILYGQKSLIQLKVREQTAKLKAEEAKNLLLLNSAGEGILELDTDGKISFANPVAQDLLGYEKHELLTKSMDDLSHKQKEDNGHFSSLELPPNYPSQHLVNDVFYRKDGSQLAVEYSITPLKKRNKILGAVVVFNDVTERLENQVKLEKMARLDMLTGLPNRYSFMEFLTQALARAQRNNTIMAVCFIDIDNFKQINDNYGHLIGDSVIRLIPKLLSQRLRNIDLLARLGGDEFGLILENISSIPEINKLVTNYIKIIAKPLKIMSHEINTSISVGIAVYPESGDSSDELIKHADIAMYHAKEEGKNTFAFFNEEMNILLKRHHLVDLALRRAIENNEFHLVYQPQLDLQTLEITGMEVLIRLNSSILMTIHPAEFIPVAENNGTIHKIGQWVLEQVAVDYVSLQKHLPDTKITINTSVKQLENPSYYDFLSSLLVRNIMDPKNIFLEVTETSLMKNPERMQQIMSKLEGIGIRFALDDFGMGYSSMHYLKELPISIIKIDQSFVQDINLDPNDAAIVNATIKLAHGLKIVTIAEGVENKEQSDYLKSCGCDQVQGYYFAKPMKMEQLIDWLAIDYKLLINNEDVPPIGDTTDSNGTRF